MHDGGWSGGAPGRPPGAGPGSGRVAGPGRAAGPEGAPFPATRRGGAQAGPLGCETAPDSPSRGNLDPAAGVEMVARV